MAQKVILIDDFDGSEAEETVEFSIDGVTYEIDLNGENAAQMRESFSTYIDKSRTKTNRPARTRRSSSGPASKASSNGARKSSGKKGRNAAGAAVRAWALENGYEVSTRGVIPKEVKEAYAAAH